MKITEIIKSFKRNSWLIGLVILISLAIYFTGLIHYSTNFNQEQFANMEETEEYENRVDTTMRKDEFDRTLYYWGNNLKLGAYHLIPIMGVNFLFISEYNSSWASAYQYQFGGIDYLFGFLGGTFAHRIPESIGFFLLAALSLYILKGAVTKEIITKTFWKDYLTLASIGFLLIFIAGPIESYISPHLLSIFYQNLWLSIVATVGIFGMYIHLFLYKNKGFSEIKRQVRNFLFQKEKSNFCEKI